MHLKVSQPVWVSVVATGGEAAGVVLSVASDRIGIRFPELQAPLPGCLPDSVVALRVQSAQGSLAAQTSVLRVQSSPQVMITVRAPGQSDATQKRRLFRTPAKLPVVCTIAASPHGGPIGRVDRAAKTNDISAGGMSMLTTLPLQVGDELVLSLSLANLGTERTAFELIGHVLRVAPAASTPQGFRTSAGIKFVHRNQREEDALARLMLDLQRRNVI